MSPINIPLVLVVFAVSTTLTSTTNIEQLKLERCMQSSTFSPSSGCNEAIDGHSKFCSRTNKGANEWWSARTECKAHFRKIRVYNARGRHQLKKFDILVDGKVCASHRSSRKFLVKNFDCDQVGQVITIRSVSGCLVLCEVRAFGELIRRPSKEQCSIRSARQCFEPGKLLLFTISAGANVSALAEYRDTNSAHTALGDTLPSIYRSEYLNDLPSAINRFGADRIVVEMRKDDNVTVQAVFNVSDSDGLTSENWFNLTRLVSSSPYEIGGRSFLYFSIAGYDPDHRTFYMQYSHDGCPADKGFMGIGDSPTDACSWVRNGLTDGRAPVLFYSTNPSLPYSSFVSYADQYLIYMACDSDAETSEA